MSLFTLSSGRCREKCEQRGGSKKPPLPSAIFRAVQRALPLLEPLYYYYISTSMVITDSRSLRMSIGMLVSACCVCTCACLTTPLCLPIGLIMSDTLSQSVYICIYSPLLGLSSVLVSIRVYVLVCVRDLLIFVFL